MQLSSVPLSRQYFCSGVNPKLATNNVKQIRGRAYVIVRAAADKMDVVDQRQAVDIERLINCVQELQDKVEKLEGEISQAEARDRDRMIALRSIIKESLASGGLPTTSTDVDNVVNRLDVAHESVMQSDKDWDSARNSFTLLMSKGYLQTMEQMRDKLMSIEWEIGRRPMALQLGVSKFEDYCSSNDVAISFDVISKLHEDPCNLEVIEDEKLRMKARSCIAQVESQARMDCFAACTTEAQKLAQQFSEGEFISKLLPDPIEKGVIDGVRKIIMPITRILSGGR